ASLQERLVRRGQDDEETIARRFSAAREEMRHCIDFDYVIINQDFASAVADLAAIVRASRLRSAQQCVRHRGLLAQLT
ncbi:MAG: guanylate kinase, partial [Betaproteobacteria bacterium]